VGFHGGNSQYCLGESARNDTLIGTYSWSITDGGKDPTCDVVPVTNINTVPSHGGVGISWTDSDSILVDEYEIWRGLMHDGNLISVYPEYDDISTSTIPIRPTTREEALNSIEWTLVGNVGTDVEYYFDSIVDRGIYYYEVFAKTDSGIYSLAADNNDRALNYILGDVFEPVDGFVRVNDISVLGASYGVNDSSEFYNPFVDVGPTDDWSGSGIPLTDNKIDFGDLMIFALNYDSSKSKVVGEKSSYNNYVILELEKIDDLTWAFDLVEPTFNLKGINLVATIPEEVEVELIRGDLLDEQSNYVFLQNSDSDGLNVGMAIFGEGTSIKGNGTLFYIEFSEEVGRLRNVYIEVRDVNNDLMKYKLIFEDYYDGNLLSKVR
ncbi:hypothetical protein K8R33_03830, partial [archaeon]|nr:hypothetical protein [archaeon]